MLGFINTRVTALDLISPDLFVLGGKSNQVKLFDLRLEKAVKSWQTHHEGVCQVKANPHCQYGFASGGNDNKVVIYDFRNDKPLEKAQAHKAAVRAICWDRTKRHFLYSGGGTDD